MRVCGGRGGGRRWRGSGGEDGERDGRAVDRDAEREEDEELCEKASVTSKFERGAERTIVLRLITSTKPLTTSASVSATTLVLPTTTTSLFMHSSHSTHCRASAGILFS